MRFKNAITDKIKIDEPFFAGFDSARNASCYFYNMKDNTKLECTRENPFASGSAKYNRILSEVH